MQEKSDIKCHPAFARVDKYRIHTGKTWAEVAKDLGIGVSALMMVKSGKRGLSDKVLYRLTQAEITSGVEPPITGGTTMQTMHDQILRTGRSAPELMTPEYRRKRMQRVRESIKQNEEMLKMIQDSIRQDREELAELEGANESASAHREEIAKVMGDRDHPARVAAREHITKKRGASDSRSV